MSTKTMRSGETKVPPVLGPTDVLVLTLISHAAPSLYALQRETSLSSGALFPALTRLRAKGLLHLRSTGPRKRQELEVSSTAQKKVEDSWTSLAADHIADFDAVLKLCKAAENFNLPWAVEYAQGAREFRTSELRKYTNRNGQIEAPPLDVYKFSSYRSLARFHQLQAEERTLNVLETALKAEL